VSASFALSKSSLADFTSKKAKSVATPACRALAERLVATWGVGKKAPPDVDLDAAAAVALYEVAEILADEREVVHLARVLVRAVHLRCKHVSVAFDDPQPWSASWTYFEESATPHFEHDYELNMIASGIAARVDQNRDGVREVLAAARAGAPIATRVLYGEAMADQEWIREAARAFLGENKSDHPATLASSLFDVVTDVDLLNALAKRFPQDVPLSVLEKYGAAMTEAAIAHHSWNTNDEHATRALARIENALAARELARSLPRARSGAIAKEYFRAHPDLARTVLEPLRNDATLGIYARALLDPRPVATAQSDGRKPLPEFANPAALPALEHVDAVDLLHALRGSTIAKPHPIVIEARAVEDASRLGAFANALFEQWLVDNASSLDAWAMNAIAHIGDDASARALAARVLEWAKKSQNNRARAGVDVLAALGTPYALMQLERISESKHEIGRGANTALDAIATARDLVREQLADRSVPDLGLDAHRIARFDFGPRIVEVAVDDDFVLARLPKAKKSDDAAKVDLATRRHKALRDDLKLLSTMQIARLERAMCTRTWWIGADFRTFVLGNPIIASLARRLVWGVFRDDTLAATFTLDEDDAPMTCDGRPYVLADGASVGIVHRLEMTDDDVRAWAEHFAQYEKLSPFDQIGRAVYPAEPAELGRFTNMELADRGIDRLEARGWRKTNRGVLKGNTAITLDRTRIVRIVVEPDLSKIDLSELVRDLELALAEM
jgi:hypothetical protein